jgi:hypothetical protein
MHSDEVSDAFIDSSIAAILTANECYFIKVFCQYCRMQLKVTPTEREHKEN